MRLAPLAAALATVVAVVWIASYGTPVWSADHVQAPAHLRPAIEPSAFP
jgi:hypothetical protein